MKLIIKSTGDVTQYYLQDAQGHLSIAFLFGELNEHH